MLLFLAVCLAGGAADDLELRDIVSQLQARVDAQDQVINALRAQLMPANHPRVGGEACRTAPFAWPCAPSAEARTPARPFEQFERVMMVTAHPDDESIGSGTLARFAQLGREVTIVCLTNGDKGTALLNVSSTELARTRAIELQRAAAALGAKAVMLGYEDGNLQNTYEARMRVAAQIRMHRPELLVTFNPQYNFNHFQYGTEHKDHKASGAIALDAFYPTARDHLQFKELWWPDQHRATLRKCCPELSNLTQPLQGWKVREAYLFAAEKIGRVSGGNGGNYGNGAVRYETVEVALDDALLEKKARSLSMHVSQTGGASWQALLPDIRNHSAILGAASDTITPYAEWFTRVVNMP